MSRKRSVGGRSRLYDVSSNLLIKKSKIDRKINQLEKNKLLDTYAYNNLKDFVVHNKNLKIKNNLRGTKKIVINSGLSQAQSKLISKKFDAFLKSRYSSKIGIENARRQARDRLTSSLSSLTGKEMSDRDVDKFIEIVQFSKDDKNAKLLEYVDPSTFIVLSEYSKDNNFKQKDFINLINQYVDTNNEYIRKSAKYLYKKYVK